MRPLWLLLSAMLAVVACGGSSPPPASPPAAEEDDADAGPPEPEPVVTTTPADTPERTRPPSTASFEDATRAPEALDIHDEHAHLTDAQLTGPMRTVLTGCRVPGNAKITIRTAVQNGRAIGVTVDVRFVRAKGQRPPPKATQKAQAKTAARIASCVDRNVRAVVWPPSRRRDSFTTEY